VASLPSRQTAHDYSGLGVWIKDRLAVHLLTPLTLTPLTATLGEMAQALATAAETFERTLEELGVSERDVGDPAELGRRAALLAAAEGLWSKRLGPLLRREQVQELLGVGSRQAVSQLAKRRRLLALPHDDRLTFPAFQFSPNGRPYEAMPTILAAFEDAGVSPYTIASWFTTPQRLLGRVTPATWLRRERDSERVVEAARRSAARLAH
jgi:hypothetical protein